MIIIRRQLAIVDSTTVNGMFTCSYGDNER